MRPTKSIYRQIRDGLTQLLGQDLTAEQAGVLHRLRQGELTPEQFDYCVREAPDDALYYCAIKLREVKFELRHYSNYLTQAQLDYCVSRREKFNYLFFECLEASLEAEAIRRRTHILPRIWDFLTKVWQW